MTGTTRRFLLGGTVLGGVALTASPAQGVDAAQASYVAVGQLLAGDMLVGLDGGVRRVDSVTEDAAGFHVSCSTPEGLQPMPAAGGGGFPAGREFLVLGRGVPLEALAPALPAVQPPMVIDGGGP